MIHETALFNFQEIVNNIRDKASEPDSEEKNLLPILSKITEQTELEDLPFYKDYMSKFNLEHDLEGLELSYDPIFEEYHSDIMLLLRFVVTAFSSTYDLDYNVYTGKATLTINVVSENRSMSNPFDTLSTIQIYKLFLIYLKEQLQLEYLLETEDTEREGIEEERQRILDIYRDKIRSLKGAKKRKRPQSAFKITIRDEEGLGDKLIQDHYLQSEVDHAKHLIKKHFKQLSEMLLQESLGKNLPRAIFVDLVSDDSDESKGWNVLASLDLKNSRENLLYFRVYRPVVVDIIENGRWSDAKPHIIHELIHACDLKSITQNRKLLNTLELNRIKSTEDSHQEDLAGVWSVLHDTIRVFTHLRDEGVAILGEHLLSKKQFGDVSKSVDLFFIIFCSTLLKSQLMIGGNLESDDIFDESLKVISYDIAPTIIVLVLLRRGDIGILLSASILHGLQTGKYELTDSETNSIIRASLSLSLADFIQGIMMLGEEIAPAIPFLSFCALVQDNLEHDGLVTASDMKAFAQLFNLGQKDPEKVYQKVMGKITRKISSETEIDEYYKEFRESKAKRSTHSHLMEKVDALYSCFKNEENQKNKHVAQLALTYLFNHNDLINDNIEGIGLIDDVTVIDHALKIVGLYQPNTTLE